MVIGRRPLGGDGDLDRRRPSRLGLHGLGRLHVARRQRRRVVSRRAAASSSEAQPPRQLPGPQARRAPQREEDDAALLAVDRADAPRRAPLAAPRPLRLQARRAAQAGRRRRRPPERAGARLDGGTADVLHGDRGVGVDGDGQLGGRVNLANAGVDVGICTDMGTRLPLPPPFTAAAARPLFAGVVWLSHGLAAAIHRSAQLHPQLGLPVSMNIGGGEARADEGFLLLHCSQKPYKVQKKEKRSKKQAIGCTP